MWIYEKKLLYPIKVGKSNPKLARYLLEQYGGANGELASALTYLNQRYTMPNKVIALLNDIGTEELAHLELVGTMIYKLTKDADIETILDSNLTEHYVRHENALFYSNSSGQSFTANYLQTKGDPIADLYNNIALEERSRATYQLLINISDDVDLNDGLRFLREREIIHATRFQEAIELLKEEEIRKKFY